MKTLQQIDTFTRAYIDCALWSSIGGKYGECPCCGNLAVLDRLPEPEYEQVVMCAADGCGVREMNCEPPLDENYSPEDIAPATLSRMISDCEMFQADNADALERAYAMGSGPSARDYDSESAGHDFWLTRNRHGAGFWDRGFGNLGKVLTDAAHAWGSFDLYVSDDGQIHGS